MINVRKVPEVCYVRLIRYEQGPGPQSCEFHLVVRCRVDIESVRHSGGRLVICFLPEAVQLPSYSGLVLVVA